MGVNFERTFGAGSTQNSAPASTGSASNNQPKCQVWLNVGYVAEGAGENGEDRFVSLPVGIPVETTEKLATTSRNEGYAQFQAARNDLLDQILSVGNELAPGEERMLNLSIQLRRISDEKPAPATGTNPFARALDL